MLLLDISCLSLDLLGLTLVSLSQGFPGATAKWTTGKTTPAQIKAAPATTMTTTTDPQITPDDHLSAPLAIGSTSLQNSERTPGREW